jgi:uncharacterized protein YlxW (UPF0749 family)
MTETISLVSKLTNQENIFTVLTIFLIVLAAKEILTLMREQRVQKQEEEKLERERITELENEVKNQQKRYEETLISINKELMDKVGDISHQQQKIAETLEKIHDELREEIYDIHKELNQKADRNELLYIHQQKQTGGM